MSDPAQRQPTGVPETPHTAATVAMDMASSYHSREAGVCVVGDIESATGRFADPEVHLCRESGEQRPFI
jgi:hypothetical protein